MRGNITRVGPWDVPVDLFFTVTQLEERGSTPIRAGSLLPPRHPTATGGHSRHYLQTPALFLKAAGWCHYQLMEVGTRTAHYAGEW
jgi:hypothetical protein